MAGLSFDEQMSWRYEIEDRIKDKTDVSIKFVHPPLYYNHEEKGYKSQEEIKQWEIAQIRNSDIVIVNLDGINDSVGTHFELGVIDSMNDFGSRHIHALGIGKLNENIHPWIMETFLRCEDDCEKMAEYVVNYLLV